MGSMGFGSPKSGLRWVANGGRAPSNSLQGPAAASISARCVGSGLWVAGISTMASPLFVAFLVASETFAVDQEISDCKSWSLQHSFSRELPKNMKALNAPRPCSHLDE